MAKKFEDVLSDNLTDMISICLEYAEYRVEKVFVYASAEKNCTFANFFFQNHGHILNGARLNDVLLPGEKQFDTHPDRQGQVLEILFADFNNIKKACKEYGVEIPKEIKASYDLRTNQFDSHIGYENVWSIRRNADEVTIMREWEAEEQRKLDLGMSR